MVNDFFRKAHSLSFFCTLLLFSLICPLKVAWTIEAILLSEWTDQAQNRVYKNMVLKDEEEMIYFCLSLPTNIPERGIQSIIIIAGLETGQENVRYISDPGSYAMIGYEYPSIIKKKKYTPWNILDIRRALLSIPNQVLHIANWSQNQKWSDHTVCVAGFSLGAMFVPAIYNDAEKNHISLGPGVIAYAGADLYPLFYANFPGSKVTKLIKAVIATAIAKPLEPSKILPHLQGDFLIINGTRDTKVPFAQAKKLQELTPEPKTIINLDTNHLSLENVELLKQLNTICKQWIDEKLKKP